MPAIRCRCSRYGRIATRRADVGWAVRRRAGGFARPGYADAADVATRKQLAQQIQRRALDVGPYWPLGMIFGIRGYRSDLGGFPKVPVPVYWNISRKTSN